MQVVNVRNADFIVHARWGNVGCHGKSKRYEHLDIVAAKTLFVKLFYQKTGLRWSQREQPALKGRSHNLLK